VALAGGVGFGLMARPDLDFGGPGLRTSPATAPAPAPSREIAATPTPDRVPDPAQVPIAVSEPPPEPPPAAPKSHGRLATLPPEMAAAARRAAAANLQTSTLDDQAARAGIALTPARPSPPPQPAPPIAAPVASAPAPPPLHASFDCARAQAGAEQEVCADPALAAADRRLARAYRRALDSGVDPIGLRQEQRDWTEIREDAARHSPRALASVYAQRTAELDAIASDGPPEGYGE
jgi:uncharacterized protein YecT (DUF1311 family)